jgi:hypothetical protein
LGKTQKAGISKVVENLGLEVSESSLKFDPTISQVTARQLYLKVMESCGEVLVRDEANVATQKKTEAKRIERLAESSREDILTRTIEKVAVGVFSKIKHGKSGDMKIKATSTHTSTTPRPI